MDISEKSKLKDIIILSLIDSLSEIYSINLNVSKDIIYNGLVTKLNTPPLPSASPGNQF